MLNLRLHAGKSGVNEVSRLIITGGASENPAILQIIADVFGVEILSISQKDSASVGAALRAAHALSKEDSFGAMIDGKISYEVGTPNTRN